MLKHVPTFIKPTLASFCTDSSNVKINNELCFVVFPEGSIPSSPFRSQLILFYDSLALKKHKYLQTSSFFLSSFSFTYVRIKYTMTLIVDNHY